MNISNPSPDDMLADIQYLASRAVEHAQQTFGITLDYSPDSLRQVETILGNLYSTRPKNAFQRLFNRKNAPTPKQVISMATAYGSYVGEVIRKRWGGTWSAQSATFAEPTVTLHLGPTEEVYPLNKVQKRLVNGEEDSIWFYYQVLARDHDSQAE